MLWYALLTLSLTRLETRCAIRGSRKKSSRVVESVQHCFAWLQYFAISFHRLSNGNAHSCFLIRHLIATGNGDKSRKVASVVPCHIELGNTRANIGCDTLVHIVAEDGTSGFIADDLSQVALVVSEAVAGRKDDRVRVEDGLNLGTGIVSMRRLRSDVLDMIFVNLVVDFIRVFVMLTAYHSFLHRQLNLRMSQDSPESLAPAI